MGGCSYAPSHDTQDIKPRQFPACPASPRRRGSYGSYRRRSPPKASLVSRHMAIARAVDSFQRRMAALEAKSWINNKLPDSGIIFLGQAADYAPPLFRSIT